MANDKEIGARVRRLRGDLSQKVLAELMKERGWKWSQPTVVSIEGGERPLKLAEAEDLAGVLGASMADLLDDAPGTLETQMVMAWADTRRDIESTSVQLRGLLERMDGLADLIESRPDIADLLWGSEGGNDWERWIGYEVRSNSLFQGQQVIVGSEERREALLRALATISHSLVRASRGDDGEHQATS
ncbi:helix-turn-helix transcriptional regulator [uncultured Microbacterium sp.]|uniref:helix-turn-helix domain-containing protein n=1 Tax=uncultured Microbacterium sp. TaxID=191216 RepID=UPI0028D8BA6D|nr:helix-turn-helix transcriptional regulator [uncultured Microbacterium sp.]